MLHQNNGRVQKPGRSRRGGNRHQVAGRIDQPHEKGVGSLFHTSSKKTPDPFFKITGSEVTPVNRVADALAGQGDRGKPRQHPRKRNHRAEPAGWLALDRVKRQSLIERDVAAPGPAKAEEMRANAERFAEIMRERPHVKAGRAVHSERDPIAVHTNQIDRVRGHAHRSWQGAPAAMPGPPARLPRWGSVPSRLRRGLSVRSRLGRGPGASARKLAASEST